MELGRELLFLNFLLACYVMTALSLKLDICLGLFIMLGGLQTIKITEYSVYCNYRIFECVCVLNVQ